MIKELKQIDRFHFEIVWFDGVIMRYKLSTLQRSCPCSKCVTKDLIKVEEFVLAHKVKSIGNYALKIDFTSGCSRGIYTFELLRKIGCKL